MKGAVISMHAHTHINTHTYTHSLQIVGKKKNQRLVIVNLQTTPLDNLAAMRVFAKCDDFTRLLMGKLGLEIPKFELKR